MPAKTAASSPAIGSAQENSPPSLSFSAKEKIRRGLAAGLHATGALRLLRRFEGTRQVVSSPASRWLKIRRFAGSKFGILCYHRVGTEGVPLFSHLDPRVFETQMRYLRKNYRLVPLGQMCREMANGDAVQPTLAITFDDGYRDLYTHAFSVLRKYEIPATIYLIGRSMETGESPWYDRIFVALDHAPGDSIEVEMDTPHRFVLASVADRRKAAWEIVCFLRTIADADRRRWCQSFEARLQPPQNSLEGRMLDWNQVRSMQASGISFGAHTMTHPSVARVESANLDEELGVSRRLLETGLNAPAEDFAYPFGKVSDCLPLSDDYLARCGYRSAVTTIEGINSFGANPFRLNRLQIGDDPALSLFAFNVARMFFEGASENSISPAATVPDGLSLESHRSAS
jgi:peptidoglycan/xylan/chitin deacetylase (PgdA/CDA1 family)